MIAGKNIGYIRVSTVDQNPDRQLEGISIDKKFIDYASGKSVNRPKLKEMMEFIREDDTVFVHSMDRLARSLRDLRDLVDTMIAKNVKVTFVKENLSFTGKDNPMSVFFLSMMGAFAEFEGNLIRERQKEGIELAKKNGRYSGRKVAMTDLKKELLIDELKTRRSLNQISFNLGVSRMTLYNYLKSIGVTADTEEPWNLIKI